MRDQFYTEYKLTIYSSVATLCTTRFKVQKFYVLPTECIYTLCLDLRTKNYYFCIQHRLDFIGDMEYVYWAVRTEPLNIIHVSLSL